MIKVPGTEAGLVAIEELTRLGVNVTLLFAVGRYEELIDAYLGGLDARAEAGETLGGSLNSPLSSSHERACPARSKRRHPAAVGGGCLDGLAYGSPRPPWPHRGRAPVRG
jgi:transaldolase/glucose-6-phosphate isomerase